MASIINAATSGGLISTADTSGILQLQTAGTTAVTVDASQNVGIGIASPATKLQVNNSANSGNTISVTGLTTATGAADIVITRTGTESATQGLSPCVTLGNTSASRYSSIASYQGGFQFFGFDGSSWLERVRITSGGDMEFKNSGGTSVSFIGVSSTAAQFGNRQNDAMILYTNNTERGRFASSGEFIVGIESTGSFRVDASSGLQTIGARVTSGSSALGFKVSSGGSYIDAGRFDSSGNLLVGTTSTISGAKFAVVGSVADLLLRLQNTSATTPAGIDVNYSGAAPNDTTNVFFQGRDTSAVRFNVRSNGGIANFSANNVNLSDERTKTDIQDAGGYLAKICAIPVRTFKYKDQTDDLLNLGCIAQEVEAVAPELVDASGFGETPEDGIPLKAIYQTDLQYALMKCIQEQQALIQSLKARLDAANL